MNSNVAKCSGSLRRRPAAHGSEAFTSALHSVYDKACGKSNGVPVYVSGPTGLKNAGHVLIDNGRRILRKTQVSKARHYCRKYDAYGVELDALRQAEKLGARAVRLEFADSSRILEASFATLAQFGIRDNLGGFGVQVFLPLDYWRGVQA